MLIERGLNGDRSINMFRLPRPSEYTLGNVKMILGNEKFDQVSQSITFLSELGETSGEHPSGGEGLGQKDTVNIFQWLRQKKDVGRRIIKVIVNDFDKPRNRVPSFHTVYVGFKSKIFNG
ncbi:putative Peptidase S8/S53 domain-containing protein [Seiridium unicorne]|uniref:Peptidase S8/S53 domain-containing protein n=1 Tax=Seiridium unicorne TaxID=138068 RepID=A0ABR2VA39_9PEZI